MPKCVMASHKQRADAAAESGSFPEAIAEYWQAVKEIPRDTRAHAVILESIAQCFMEMDCDTEAKEVAIAAVANDPSWADAHLTLARANLNMKLPQAAIDSFRRVLELQPDHPEISSVHEDLAAATALIAEAEAQRDDKDLQVAGVTLRIRQSAGQSSQARRDMTMDPQHASSTDHSHGHGRGHGHSHSHSHRHSHAHAHNHPVNATVAPPTSSSPKSLEVGSGARIWECGIVLAKLLEWIVSCPDEEAACAREAIVKEGNPDRVAPPHARLCRLELEGAKVVELGSGTGIAGLACAALGAQAMLTDLPSVLESITRGNVSRNASKLRGNVLLQSIEWEQAVKELESPSTEPASSTKPLISLPEQTNTNQQMHELIAKADIFLAADCVFNPNSVPLFPRLMARLLHARHRLDSSRAVCALFVHKPRHEALDRELWLTFRSQGVRWPCGVWHSVRLLASCMLVHCRWRLLAFPRGFCTQNSNPGECMPTFWNQNPPRCPRPLDSTGWLTANLGCARRMFPSDGIFTSLTVTVHFVAHCFSLNRSIKTATQYSLPAHLQWRTHQHQVPSAKSDKSEACEQ